MKKNIVALVAITCLLLAGCGTIQEGSETTQTGDNRKAYNVNVKKLQDFSKEANLQKYGTIASTKDILVTAQVMGTVERIVKDAWQSVREWQTIIQLEDSLSNYGLMLEKSDLWVTSSVLQYKTTELTLGQQIEDAEMALEQARFAYETAQASTEQAVKQALTNYNDSKVDLQDSQASLSLDQTKTNLGTSLDGLYEGLVTQRITLENHLEDVLHQTDSILWATKKYEAANDSYERYLSIRNTKYKNEAKSKVRQMYILQKEFKDMLINENMSGELMQERLEKMKKIYREIDEVLEKTQLVLQYSVTPDSVSQSMINGLVAGIDGLESAYTMNYAGLIQFEWQLDQQLAEVFGSKGEKTILDQQLALAEKGLEIQEKNAETAYRNAVIQQKDLLFKAEIAVEQAQETLDMLKANREHQLSLAQTSIKTAKNTYDDVFDQRKKLSVSTPIRGTIDRVLVDEWQEVSLWTPLFSVVGSTQQQIEFGVDKEELSFVKKWAKVTVYVRGEEIDGFVSSISAVADTNMQYTVTVLLKNSKAGLWEFARVEIPVRTKTYLIPLENIYLVSEGSAYVYTLSWLNDYRREFVDVGMVRGDVVEVHTTLLPNKLVIVSSMDAYNANDFVIEPTLLKKQKGVSKSVLKKKEEDEKNIEEEKEQKEEKKELEKKEDEKDEKKNEEEKKEDEDKKNKEVQTDEEEDKNKDEDKELEELREEVDG